MANSVPGYVQNVDATIAKVVPSIKLSNLRVERSFDDVAVSEVSFPEDRLLLTRIAGSESIVESRAYNEIDAVW